MVFLASSYPFVVTTVCHFHYISLTTKNKFLQTRQSFLPSSHLQAILYLSPFFPERGKGYSGYNTLAHCPAVSPIESIIQLVTNLQSKVSPSTTTNSYWTAHMSHTCIPPPVTVTRSCIKFLFNPTHFSFSSFSQIHYDC